MVPHFKYYLNYSQRNSNSKLGLKLQTLKTGAESPFVNGPYIKDVRERGWGVVWEKRYKTGQGT